MKTLNFNSLKMTALLLVSIGLTGCYSWDSTVVVDTVNTPYTYTYVAADRDQIILKDTKIANNRYRVMAKGLGVYSRPEVEAAFAVYSTKLCGSESYRINMMSKPYFFTTAEDGTFVETKGYKVRGVVTCL